MDRVILALRKRVFLALVAVAGVIVWLGLCHAYYQSYWGGTIRRVQTVDFNMLHACLPATLSYWILTGEDASVQRLLDSTYGIFGLVVTDSRGKRIIFKTDKVYHDPSWQKALEKGGSEFLKQSLSGPDGEPFDQLTDPPPLAPVYKHHSPRSDKAEQLLDDTPAQGRPIGRVYYIRQPPPPFLGDLGSALLTLNWWELSGAKRGYQLYTLNVVAYCAIITLIYMWRRQILESKTRELKAVETELSMRRRTLDQLNHDLNAQKQRKEWLENEAELAYQRATRLKESLEKLKEAFFLVDMSPTGRPIDQANRSGQGKEPHLSVRPPLHPSSAIAEVESLLPELTNNARILRSQAEVLQSYCSQLEQRQSEMQQILEHRMSSLKVSAPGAAEPALKTGAPGDQTAP